MDQNPFLKQFVNMRKNLHVKQDEKKETKAMADPTGVTMSYIIENKPPQKEVIEYFKNRCEVLSNPS
jgi:hypothetical protein